MFPMVLVFMWGKHQKKKNQASCTMGTGSFPGVKSGRGVMLMPHPLLVPWSRKSRAIPLLPLWTVRPVQSLSASTRVHFTFFLHSSSSTFTSTGIRQSYSDIVLKH